MKITLLFLAFVTNISFGQSLALPPWQEGFLDIHHISTGSGNAALMIFPDGTTLLLDAGDVDRKVRLRTPNPLKVSPPLPFDSVTAGVCIVQYIKHFLPTIKTIDYAVISHFHTDHYGSVSSTSRLSVKGNYYLSGITEVNEFLPIQNLIDRNYPQYNYPVDIALNGFDKESFSNYKTFVETQVAKNAISVGSLVAGSHSQIVARIHPTKFPLFRVQNIKVNGNIWTGVDEAYTDHLPTTLSVKEYNENPLSLALKISYGKFDYFTGGDITGLQGFGMPPWFDMETPVAKVVGKVEALTLNHHGVRDASNETFLRTTAPQVLVQQSWSSNHPGEEVLHRIISPFIWPEKRDIFATFIHPETITTYGRWLEDNYRSKHGHIVIRVSPGGQEFYVYVLDDTTQKPTVLNSFGPYRSN